MYVYSYYTQICENLEKGWTERWVDEQKVPYAYHRNQWVGYENEHSVRLKVRAHV